MAARRTTTCASRRRTARLGLSHSSSLRYVPSRPSPSYFTSPPPLAPFLSSPSSRPSRLAYLGGLAGWTAASLLSFYHMCVKTAYRQAGAFSFFFFKVYLPGTGPFFDIAMKLGAFLSYFEVPEHGPFFDIAMKLGAFAAKLYRRVKPSKYRKRKDYASIELATMESRSLAATFLAAFGEPVSNDSRTHVTLVSPHAQDKQAAFSTFRASHSVMSQPIGKAARALVSAVRLLDTVVNVEDLAKYNPSGVLNMVVSFGHPMCRNAVRLLDTVVNVEDLAKYDPSGVLNMVVSFGHPMCRDERGDAGRDTRGRDKRSKGLKWEDLAKYHPSGVLDMVVAFGHPMCRDGESGWMWVAGQYGGTGPCGWGGGESRAEHCSALPFGGQSSVVRGERDRQHTPRAEHTHTHHVGMAHVALECSTPHSAALWPTRYPCAMMMPASSV
ncbi:unnamed protein product [Closterium sp. Naga37s-1]|nr:unnamed protein product [Closterium sp. Naga37s-1]